MYILIDEFNIYIVSQDDEYKGCVPTDEYEEYRYIHSTVDVKFMCTLTLKIMYTAYIHTCYTCMYTVGCKDSDLNKRRSINVFMMDVFSSKNVCVKLPHPPVYYFQSLTYRDFFSKDILAGIFSRDILAGIFLHGYFSRDI